MSSIAKRVSALEAERDGHGVVVISVYEGETVEQAKSAHVAQGGVDPDHSEITAIIDKPGPRPDCERVAVVIRKPKEDGKVALLAERRKRVAALGGDE
jgi:hypothetical protein